MEKKIPMNDIFGELGQLQPAPGSIKKKKRIGRGRGSGHGDTATKGHKGQTSRSGWKVKVGFEGGQMPLKRRIPKRGFTPFNKTEYREVNISDLNRMTAEVIDPESLRTARLVKGRGPIVLLGQGDLDRAVKVSVHRVTGSAKEKIMAAGGSVELLPIDPEFLRVKRGPKKVQKKSKKSL